MPTAPAVKPKDLTAYYAALEAYEKQGVTHEGALRSAFQNLLAETVAGGTGCDVDPGIGEWFHSARRDVSG